MAEPAPRPGPHRAVLLTLFALSGAVALIYEVVWTRALLLLLGSTAAASSLVIALFVAGLGLGARWGGTQVSRRNPMRLYALCEIGAAAWAALALPLLALLDGPYVALAQSSPVVAWVLRALLAALVVLPSSFLLGATLPALVAQWVRVRGTAATGTAWLYGINALGAAVGALLPAWWALERFGVQGTLYGAVVLGLAIGGVAWFLGHPGVAGMRSRPDAVRLPAALAGLALGAGALGLCVEIVGFRILVFFLEGFTVTFAAMLATFVLGLAAGSLTLGPWLVRWKQPRRALALVLAIEAVLLLAVWFFLVPSFESWMGDVKRHWFEGATTPADVATALKGAGLVGALSLLFVPAFFLGPTFALCVRIAEQHGAQAGQAVGFTYLWNSVGSLAGPVVATFVLVPILGVGTLWLALAITAGVWALWLWLAQPEWGRAHRIGAVALAGALVVPTLDAPLLEHTVVLKANPGRKLIEVATDATTTASVVQTADGERLLYTDDFPAAAVGRHYRYMRMLGLLPCILAKDPANTMVIAYGTGTTAGAVAEMPGVKRIEVVEVSRAVLDLAPHFTDVNRNVLKDARTTVIRDDGRNALRLHAADLDVITLEPLMPYSPAGLPFYTREFYELARDRLRDGGVVCQWVPVHAMPAELYAAFLRTFFEVFPHGTLWFFEQSTALIGRKGGTMPTHEDVVGRVEAVGEALEEAGFPLLESLASAYLANGKRVLESPAPRRSPGLDPKRVVRDLDPYPEFFPTPRARLSTPYLAHTLEYLATLVDDEDMPTGAPWWTQYTDPTIRKTTASAMAARWQDALAETLSLQIRARPPGHPDLLQLRELRRAALKNAAKGYATVRAALPDDPVYAWRHVRTLRRHATTEAMYLIGRARVAPDDAGRREHASMAARVMFAALPPALADRDAFATERIPAYYVLVAALLQLGRGKQALDVVRASGSADEMRDLEQSLAAFLDGAAPETLVPRWVFANAAPNDGSDERDLREAFDDASQRTSSARRRALKQLAARARRDALLHTLLALSSAWEPGDIEGRVVKAALQERLGMPGQLAAWFEDPETAVLALQEAAAWSLLHRHVDRLDAFATSKQRAWREALANAAATWTAKPIQRRVVELLGDEERGVRVAAWTALLPHAKDVLQAYTPDMPRQERQAVIEQLRPRFR